MLDDDQSLYDDDEEQLRRLTKPGRASRFDLALARSGRRGNDGLTRRERARYAAEWRAGAGARSTKAEMDALQALANSALPSPGRGAAVTYFKAVCPDGKDFRTGTVDYGAALASGEIVRHPDPGRGHPRGYLSVSVSAADCTGFRWPCRLLVVEPVGDVWTDPGFPSKRCCHELRVVGERPAHEVFGPQGEAVAALIERAGRLTREEADRLRVAWGAARDVAWGAAGDVAWDAARDAARAAARAAARDAAGDAALGAAGDAARALVVADLITPGQYQTLAGPWESVMGPLVPATQPEEGAQP